MSTAVQSERGDASAERVEEATLSPTEVRRRAVAGTVMVAGRGAAIRLMALAGNLVLARLLAPSDFGYIALGTSFLIFANFLSAAGLGGALIRRPEAPTRRELEALLGIQLAGTTVVSALILAGGWQLGTGGKVVGIMVASMPFIVFRTPASILLERTLSYRPLVAVELGETIIFYGWAIATVASGWGVWGYATAYIVRGIAGSTIMMFVAPQRIVRPRLEWKPVRALLGFGLKFEGVGVTRVFFEQGQSLGTVAIAGVPVLGLWTLARRLLEIPAVLFESLWRISFPAMSRLLAAGERTRSIMERGVAQVAVVTGAILVGIVGLGPHFIPLVFGDQWQEASSALPLACAGVMLSAPISVATTGYLYAVDRPTTVLVSAIATSVIALAVTFSLLNVAGVDAFGWALIAMGLAEAGILANAVRWSCSARVIRPMATPAAAAFAAGACGWLIADALPANALSLVAGCAAGEVLFLGLLLATRRNLLIDVLEHARRALRPLAAQVGGAA